MFCNTCGKEIAENNTFCTACGAQIAPVPMQAVLEKAVIPPPEETAVSPPYTNEGVPLSEPMPARPLSPAKPKKPRRPLPKGIWLTVLFHLLLALSYVGVALVTVHMFDMAEVIGVESLFKGEIHRYMSLGEYTELLIKGNDVFVPTAVSTALGVGVNMALYCIPLFAAVAFLGTAIGGRRCTALHVLSVMVSLLFSALVALVTPLSLTLIPEMKSAVADQLVLLAGDVGAFSCTPLIVWTIVTAVLVATTVVFTVIVNKRRAAR